MNMKDIAALAGVSKATVSRVINNPDTVRPLLRQRVQQVLNETGYTPNLLARDLATKRTQSIGVIVPKIGTDIFAQLTEGIVEHLDQKGYHMLLSKSRGQVKEEIRYLQLFKKKHVDGIILFTRFMTPELKEELKRLSIPLVVIGEKCADLPASTLSFDDYHAAKAIVHYLAKQGHQSIGYLGIKEDLSLFGTRRYEGYVDGLRENGLTLHKDLSSPCDFKIQSGYEGAKFIFEGKQMVDMPTAIFASMDRLAYGALRYLHENNYTLPKDVALVGIDNMEQSAFTTPTLTSVDFNYYEAGLKASELLMKVIENPDHDAYHHIMGYKLVERESSAGKST